MVPSAQARQLSELAFSSERSSCRRTASTGLFGHVNPGAESAVKPRNEISFDHRIEKGERQNPETRPGLLSSGLRVFATTVQD